MNNTISKVNELFSSVKKIIYRLILFSSFLLPLFSFSSKHQCSDYLSRRKIAHDKSNLLDYDCRYLKNLTEKKITPENTIFAFDLHEVLFNRSYTTMIIGGFKLFLKSLFFAIFHPLFFFKLISVSREPMVCEGMYIKLREEYPYIQNWEQDIFDLANGCCYPEETMIDLLVILKERGYKIFLLSNIGADALLDFRRRFGYVNELFDGFYTPSRTNNYSYKPILSFYKGFKDYLASQGYENKQIVFIDDIERNIVGATYAGIAGIHFTGYDNLCATLDKLGISINKQVCNHEIEKKLLGS